MTEPTQLPANQLTDSQKYALKDFVEEKWAAVSAEVNARIAAAMDSLQEQIDALKAQLDTTLKVGDKIGLRAHSGKAMGAADGGPTVDEKPFVLVAKTDVNAWESWTVEKGQGG